MYVLVGEHTYKDVKDFFRRGKSGRLNKLTLLQVSLIIQHTTKVNISHKTVEYSTSKIVNIISSNMNSCQIQEYGTLC